MKVVHKKPSTDLMAALKASLEGTSKAKRKKAS
jgi:non-homologous end joining protein Ku